MLPGSEPGGGVGCDANEPGKIAAWPPPPCVAPPCDAPLDEAAPRAGVGVAVAAGAADSSLKSIAWLRLPSTLTPTVSSPATRNPAGATTLTVYLPASRSANRNLPSASVIRVCDPPPKVRRTSTFAAGRAPPGPSDRTMPEMTDVLASSAEIGAIGRTNRAASSATAAGSPRRRRLTTKIGLSRATPPHPPTRRAAPCSPRARFSSR